MYLFYVNMQKRRDGRVYPDLHKTDGMGTGAVPQPCA